MMEMMEMGKMAEPHQEMVEPHQEEMVKSRLCG